MAKVRYQINCDCSSYIWERMPPKGSSFMRCRDCHKILGDFEVSCFVNKVESPSFVNKEATFQDAIKAKWKFVKKGAKIGSHKAEDNSIYTEDNKEVIGCSEWLRADEEILKYIINLHNDNHA